MSKLNPPILENTLPAFIKTVDGIGYLSIPFQLNRSVSKSDFNQILILIKSVQSNIKLYERRVFIQESNFSGVQGYVQITLTSSEDFVPIPGQYYKIQIAFVDTNNEVGYYSNVGIIKCINQPIVFFKDRDNTVINTHDYIGVYQNSDITEKVYSYKFSLYDETGVLLETSGELLHNSENDLLPNESTDHWSFTTTLKSESTYEIGYQVKTINGYQCNEIRSKIIEINVKDPNIRANLSVKNDFENGYNSISLIGDHSNKLLNGSFILLRSSSEDNYSSWTEICRYQLYQWDTNTVKEICRDYCLRQGHFYKYSVQAYNSKGLYSNRKENIEGPVLCDFEDCFLYDGEKQLKIRFNPKVSNFKSTVLESKMDTLGGKYPFIFRNGIVEYKEFQISGLLSLMSDDNGDFFQGFEDTSGIMREKTPAAAREIPSPFGTLLTAENYRSEREYKMQALDWLTNGKPKLFRSPAEGNFIIRLMNTTLTPNDTLGRLLHTFNSTAYEIADYNYSNLKLYKFAVDSFIETRSIKQEQIDLNNPRNDLNIEEDGTIHLPSGAYLASITANPNVNFEYCLFNSNKVYQGNTNLTGVFNFPIEVLRETPLITLKLLSSTWGPKAYLTYGYYCEPDTSFTYIENINIKDQIVQQSGLGIDKNIIEQYEDLRIKIGEIHYLKVQPKFIEKIIYDENTNQYKFDNQTILRVWDKNCLYLYKDNYYIDGGNPPNIINSENYTYQKPNESILIDKNTANLFGFKLNSSNIIDFSGNEKTDGRYQSLTKLNNVEYLSAGQGIIMDIVYQEKEIVYSIEQYNEVIQRYKNLWLNKKAEYIASQENGSTLEYQNQCKSEMLLAYSNYIKYLKLYLDRELGDEEYAI